jgi:hypothetical protein
MIGSDISSAPQAVHFSAGSSMSELEILTQIEKTNP